MKALFLVGAIGLAVAGCGPAQRAEIDSARQQRAEEFKLASDAAEADYYSKKISFGQMIARAADARIAMEPSDPLVSEAAYFAKLQGARVDRKEITIDEYRYLVAKQESEFAAKRQNRTVQAITAVSAMRAAQPQPVNCTSNMVGTFTYTNCN